MHLHLYRPMQDINTWAKVGILLHITAPASRRTLDLLQLFEGVFGRHYKGAQHAVVLAHQNQVLDEG